MREIAVYLAFGIAIAVGGATAMVAQAGQRGPGEGQGDGQATFSQMVDANGDGVITRREFALFSAERFRRQDTDGSGLISLNEMMKRVDPSVAYRVVRRFGLLDANGDGAIDRVEFSANANRSFAQMDGNGDGRVTREEMRTRRGRKN